MHNLLEMNKNEVGNRVAFFTPGTLLLSVERKDSQNNFDNIDK